MPSFPFGETVTVTRQVQAKHGDRTPGISFDISGCAVWPITSTETVGGQDTVIWGLTVLMPADTDVLATDKVTVRGISYDVNGQPCLYASPLTGTQSGIEVLLRTATG